MSISTLVERWRRFRREPNPLLVKELRGRMRDARAFVVLTLYLLVLSCLTSLIYHISVEAAAIYGGTGTAAVGDDLFAGIVLAELFLVSFITPAFTAGAISGERERKTYEVLQTTPLSARRLVFGKLIPALIYIFLLILAAVPLKSLAFILGGVAVEELVLALVILLVTTFTFASVGLFCSSIARTTSGSTALSYIMVVSLTIGPPIAWAAFLDIWIHYLRMSPTMMPPLLWEIAFVYLLHGLLNASPLAAAVVTKIDLEEHNSVWYYHQCIGDRCVLVPSGWITFTVLCVALAIVLLLATIVRVHQQEAR